MLQNSSGTQPFFGRTETLSQLYHYLLIKATKNIVFLFVTGQVEHDVS